MRKNAAVRDGSFQYFFRCTTSDANAVQTPGGGTAGPTDDEAILKMLVGTMELEDNNMKKALVAGRSNSCSNAVPRSRL